jgi:hypothetical protein
MSLEYWVTRRSLSSGLAEGRTGWRVMTAGIRFSNSHRLQPHLLQPHLRDLAAGLRELYRELPAI